MYPKVKSLLATQESGEATLPELLQDCGGGEAPKQDDLEEPLCEGNQHFC